ncbi:MAG: pantoate--beta-alanine ligase [Acidobacteria bacterium]|nr:pantoate--beta-alanine ligase [Acidobacteriota bacterium]
MTLVLSTIPSARQWVRSERAAGRTIALVPTMGALHEGHLSLFRQARRRFDRVIVSVFVNPLQFGPEEDYDRYPRDFERDLALSQEEGVDAIFHPEAREMYPHPQEITVDPGKLGKPLCGVSRPGHFRGVATAVAKLFNIIQPDAAFFGQKDAQQAVIVREMAEDLNFPVAVEVCPIVREADGLAASSRNQYLSAEERARARVLYQALQRAETLVRSGVVEAPRLEREMQELIRTAAGVELDYARVVDRETLSELREVREEALLAVAARVGKTRLIDNLLIAPEK